MANANRAYGDLWEHALTFLPENLDHLATETGAIRRPRRVMSAAQMLRLFLIYAHTGSLRVAAALGRDSGLLDITSEGLFYRLRCSEAFLEQVLVHLVGQCSGAPVGYRLLVVDATTVCGPGSKGTDWRIHVGYDPCRGVPCSVQTTNSSVGEHLNLHGLQAGQLVLADRGYGTAGNVHEAISLGADILIRIQKKQIRLFDETGSKLDWNAVEATVPSTGAVSFEFDMPVSGPDAPKGRHWTRENAVAWHRLRLVAARNKDGDVVWLATNLSEAKLDAAKACELYRIRWQVELYFKRLKSLGDLDILNSRDGPTARAGILAKLILLVLTNLLCDQEQAFSPFGYRILQVRPQPMERIRMHPSALGGRSFANEPKPSQEAARQSA